MNYTIRIVQTNKKHQNFIKIGTNDTVQKTY
jgi:hypothetical protein